MMQVCDYLDIVDEMSKNSKYTLWYRNIITSTSSRILTGYTEKHHILPKSLNGMVKITRKHMITLVKKQVTMNNNKFAPEIEMTVRLPIEIVQDGTALDSAFYEKMGRDFFTLLTAKTP